MNHNIFTLNIGNGKTYFFRTSRNKCIYWQYDYILDEADAGYPKEVDQTTWPGLVNPFDIQTAILWNNEEAYFVYRDGSILLFDIEKWRSKRGYPCKMSHRRARNRWPFGLQEISTKISSALNWDNNVIYYFLKGPENLFVRHFQYTDEVSEPRKVCLGFPGLKFDHTEDIRIPEASFRWDNNKAYFFHTSTKNGKYPGGQYIRYDIKTETADENYPKSIHSGWPPITLAKKGI